MAVEEVVEEVVSALPPHVADNVGILIKILQAVGVIFIIYVIYLLVNAFINFRNRNRIKYIEKKIDSMDKKLNVILKNVKKSKKK